MFVPNTFGYNGSVVIVFVALASLLYYVIAAVLVKSSVGMLFGPPPCNCLFIF